MNRKKPAPPETDSFKRIVAYKVSRQGVRVCPDITFMLYRDKEQFRIFCDLEFTVYGIKKMLRTPMRELQARYDNKFPYEVILSAQAFINLNPINSLLAENPKTVEEAFREIINEVQQRWNKKHKSHYEIKLVEANSSESDIELSNEIFSFPVYLNRKKPVAVRNICLKQMKIAESTCWIIESDDNLMPVYLKSLLLPALDKIDGAFPFSLNLKQVLLKKQICMFHSNTATTVDEYVDAFIKLLRAYQEQLDRAEGEANISYDEQFKKSCGATAVTVPADNNAGNKSDEEASPLDDVIPNDDSAEKIVDLTFEDSPTRAPQHETDFPQVLLKYNVIRTKARDYHNIVMSLVRDQSGYRIEWDGQASETFIVKILKNAIQAIQSRYKGQFPYYVQGSSINTLFLHYHPNVVSEKTFEEGFKEILIEVQRQWNDELILDPHKLALLYAAASEKQDIPGISKDKQFEKSVEEQTAEVPYSLTNDQFSEQLKLTLFGGSMDQMHVLACDPQPASMDDPNFFLGEISADDFERLDLLPEVIDLTDDNIFSEKKKL